MYVWECVERNKSWNNSFKKNRNKVLTLKSLKHRIFTRIKSQVLWRNFQIFWIFFYFKIKLKLKSKKKPKKTHIEGLTHQSRVLILTAKSSSRSGDRSSGIITWLRKDGVLSFFSSLLIVFNWPDRRAKLSKTEGLNQTKTHHSECFCFENLSSVVVKWTLFLPEYSM